MDMETHCVTAEGHFVQKGTTLFHSRTREIFWVMEISTEAVTLESVTDNLEMDRTQFERQIDDQNILIESQPFG